MATAELCLSRTEIERHSAETRQVVAGSMTNLVEVLGIFVAIVTFLVRR